MIELYDLAKEQGKVVYHRNYCLYNNRKTIAFDVGAIRLISLELSFNPENACVTVLFENGDVSRWNTRWITAYNFQFGIAVSPDGQYIFVQTWDTGLFCLDAHTGNRVWRTKSKRGITSIFVNDRTILCQQHDRALQLVDISTGEVVAEKRPATAWGFTAIDHGHIVCRVTARRWEIIDAETMESKAAYSHRDFTGGHEDYCVKDITLDGRTIIVRGFKNVWDHSVEPAVMLPNLEFENRLELDCI